jgi:hypothetical protein
MGLEQARSVLAKRLSDPSLSRPSLVISTGFAGSWSQNLAVGDWALGQSVESHLPGEFYQLEGAPFGKIPFKALPVRMISLLSPTSKPNDLPVSRDSNLPIAVDMESFAWAKVSQSHGIPFRVLRLISDSPEAPLPEAVGSFASVLGAKKTADKLGLIAQGLKQVAGEPVNLARFLVRGTKLPKLLAQGWQEIAGL